MQIKCILCVFMLAFPVLAAGCGGPQEEVKVQEIGGQNFVVTYPSSLRGAYIKNNSSGDLVAYCAEPAPDVAMEKLQKLASQLSIKVPEKTEISADLSSELSTKVIQLAGRSELVLLVSCVRNHFTFD